MAEYRSSTPFPQFAKGDGFELTDCEPRTWDILFAPFHRITKGDDGHVTCTTILHVDSPVIENTEFIVTKQNNEKVGPSATRFGRIK